MTPTEVTLLRGVLAASGAAGGEPSGLAGVPVSSEVVAATDHRFAPVSADVLASAGARLPSRLDLTGGDPDDLTDLPVALADLADLADNLTDRTDDRAVGLLASYGGVLGVWRAWRYGPAEQRRVYIVEVEPDVLAWDLTLDLQRALADEAADLSLVEVYWTGEALPPYQRAARANAALLWLGRPVEGEVRPAE